MPLTNDELARVLRANGHDHAARLVEAASTGLTTPAQRLRSAYAEADDPAEVRRRRRAAGGGNDAGEDE